MALNPALWLRQTKAVYLDNATSKRDYRVQLRGNRSVILFGTYLFVLIGVAMIVYSKTASTGEVEVVEAQRKLKEFYGVIMALLGGLVSLIAPALTATTVVAERQRRSFDLIFSAPVSPKYFLVGKMMSSYRYTWMLLILSLPVTAACVVLGGASWTDVLTAYLLLSLHGLMLTSVGLLMSTVSPRPVTAVLWSYIASIGYLLVTLAAGQSVLIGGLMGRSSQEAPFFATLNPFLVQLSAGTYTTVGSIQVPNWVFTIFVAGLVCKICLLSAGAVISPRPQIEIRSLRIHMIVYMSALLLYISWAVSSPGLWTLVSRNAGPYLFWSMSPLFLFMPFLSTFGVDTERRYWPNGAFSIRHILDGTPSGGLPFLILFILTSAASLLTGFYFGGRSLPDLHFLSWLLYVIAFWSLFWSLGRLASSTFVGLRSARALQFATFVFLIMLPIPFVNSLTNVNLWSNTPSLWEIYPLRPVFLDHPHSDVRALGWGIGLSALALIVGAVAENRTRRKMALLSKRYEGDLEAA